MSEVLSPELIEAYSGTTPETELRDHTPEHDPAIDSPELSPAPKNEEDEKPATSPGLDLVLERHGGTEEDWKITYQESGHRFDPEARQLLDENGKSLTKEIETSSDNMSADKIAEHYRMLDHFQSNPDKAYLLPDWVEQTKNGEVIHSTIVTLDENNIFHYETRSHEVERLKPEEEDGNEGTLEASIPPSEDRGEAIRSDEVPVVEAVSEIEPGIPVLKIDLNERILESMPTQREGNVATESDPAVIAATAAPQAVTVEEKAKVSAAATVETDPAPEINAETPVAAVAVEEDRQIDRPSETKITPQEASESMPTEAVAKTELPPVSASEIAAGKIEDVARKKEGAVMKFETKTETGVIAEADAHAEAKVEQKINQKIEIEAETVAKTDIYVPEISHAPQEAKIVSEKISESKEKETGKAETAVSDEIVTMKDSTEEEEEEEEEEEVKTDTSIVDEKVVTSESVAPVAQEKTAPVVVVPREAEATPDVPTQEAIGIKEKITEQEAVAVPQEKAMPREIAPPVVREKAMPREDFAINIEAPAEASNRTETAAPQGMTGKEILLRSLGIVPERRDGSANVKMSATETLSPFAAATARSGVSSVLQTIGANQSAGPRRQQPSQQQKRASGTSLNGITLRRAA